MTAASWFQKKRQIGFDELVVTAISLIKQPESGDCYAQFGYISLTLQGAPMVLTLIAGVQTCLRFLNRSLEWSCNFKVASDKKCLINQEYQAFLHIFCHYMTDCMIFQFGKGFVEPKRVGLVRELKSWI